MLNLQRSGNDKAYGILSNIISNHHGALNERFRVDGMCIDMCNISLEKH